MAAWSQYHSGAEVGDVAVVLHDQGDDGLGGPRLRDDRYGQICNYGAYQISRGLYPGNGGQHLLVLRGARRARLRRRGVRRPAQSGLAKSTPSTTRTGPR